MHKHKIFNIILAIFLFVSLVMPAVSPASAMPASPVDESKVPHYFGPYPNWALSPLSMPDAIVTITGDGTGATAVASVGTNGAITGITITNPGSGYSKANVDITGSGTGATATATIVKKGSVVAINVDSPGSNYTTPVVTISGSGGATATAYGGVDNVTLTNAGSGYTFPTVDFDLPDDPNGVQAKAHATLDATTGAVTGIVMDDPGSGYSAAPNVVIRDGTIFSPILGGSGATATATLSILSIVPNTFGSGYNQVPTVTISDLTGIGTGATATAVLDNGVISAITLKKPGSGYITPGGIKKFQDGLSMLCDPSVVGSCVPNNLGQYLPLAVPDTTTFPGADYYVIALVQTREQMNSSLPAQGTLLREYVQLETPANASWSKHIALQTELLDGTSVPTLMPDGSQAYAVDNPHYLGPIIQAEKDRAVRLVFYNLLPTGVGGNLFFPMDSTFMGAGMGPMDMMAPMDMGSVMDEIRNPMCGEVMYDAMGMPMPKDPSCYMENRATLHLHGGITPWISDGSPHQWITPANENTDWPEGVAVRQVPDMVGQAATDAGIPDCSAANDGCMTFYYTNQQSARLMFYHDHAWGITRLNVYAGEAAGYIIRDATEKALIDAGLIPSGAAEIPLVVQERTFVPSPAQMAAQDPTWDYSRWGSEGNLWYEHVYMPAQNPNDPSGLSAYGRWFYGPWFWPPVTPTYDQIANPYYDPSCNLDDPATWQYDTDPFCEPPTIPGTPNNSAGMEQFNDTPIVNGTAYPTVTLDPKSYRLRILNAANDRFFNFQWYVADPTQCANPADLTTCTEVALDPALLAAAQTDPNIFPTPLESMVVNGATVDLKGPDWIQIGTEGGFLPAPVVVDGQQETTWIIDPTRFDVGNVDKHSLLLGPAERADVIVDFSQFAGKTLILYNDAPAAFPARISTYDYYTGGPDLSPNGAPTVLPGYGPNTRTVMQVNIAATSPAPAFNLTALNAAFQHHADGSGVFESGQNPIIVGQAGYNSAYGTNFASGSWCNNPAALAGTPCDGFARISEQGYDTFKFDTLLGPQIGVTIQPKAIHDEMNSTNFEPYGRMSGNFGVEVVPADPVLQNVVLYPFVNPPTEIFDGTNLPSTDTLTPISVGDDGTQIWKITHNGVDTHPVHFHLYDVQLLNRVTWDNIIIPPDDTELGWKDTVRVSPLEDTYFAIRPIIPVAPFEVPNSIRPENPMMPLGDTSMFNPTDPNGVAAPVVNQLVNFGAEYMTHCHILSHEEMDMMRPVVVALPPNAPDGLAYTLDATGLVLTWNDNSINETAFVVQRDGGAGWVDLGTDPSPLADPNTHGSRSFTDSTFIPGGTYQYRVVAENTVGYGGAYPSVSVQSVSDPVVYDGTTPSLAPVLTAVYQAGPQILLNWSDILNETGYVVERSTDGVNFTQLGANLAANVTTYTDTTVSLDSVYSYRVTPFDANGPLAPSNDVTVTTPPEAPSNLTAVYAPRLTVQLSWADNSVHEDGFVIERIEGDITTQVATVGPNVTTYTDSTVAFDGAYTYQVYASNASGRSALSNLAAVDAPPIAPNSLTAAYQSGVLLTWNDNSLAETGFVVERSDDGGATFTQIAALGALTAGSGVGNVSYVDTNVSSTLTYVYRVAAVNAAGLSDYSSTVSITLPAFPQAPIPGTITNQNRKIIVTWTGVDPNATGYTIQWSTSATFATIAGTGSTKANVTSFTTPNLTRGNLYYFRIRTDNGAIGSLWAYYQEFQLP